MVVLVVRIIAFSGTLADLSAFGCCSLTRSFFLSHGGYSQRQHLVSSTLRSAHRRR